MRWDDITRIRPNHAVLATLFDRIQPRPDSALNLMKSLVAHMRSNGWTYTTLGIGGLQTAIENKKINCDVMADLITCFCVYNNRNNNVNANIVQVHGNNSPVFLPQAKIIHAGLRIDMNVHGAVAGVFFSSGHRVASVNGVCFDLISGNKGPQHNMHTAYVRCTRMPAPPADRYTFDYLGQTRYLDIHGGTTSQGLQKFRCT